MAGPLTLQPEHAFEVAEYRARLSGLHSLMEAFRMDALVVHTPENVCYLTGWHTPGYYYPQFVVIKLGEEPLIVLRSMEAMGLAVRSWLDEERLVAYADTDDPIAALSTALSRLGVSAATVGIDRNGWYLPVALLDRLDAVCPDMALVDGSWLVERLRKVKSPAEIEKIEQASRIAELGMQAAVDHFDLGMTEAQLSGWVHKATVEAGCEYTGLPVFLMSGHRMLAPHSVWSKHKRIVEGDQILVELAGTVDRYAGALFRTLVAGRAEPRCRANMEIAEEMLEAAMAALRPGVTSDDVNRAVGQVAARHGITIRKRAGYSMGLNFPPDWGEGFFLELADGDQTVIEPNMVFHLPQVVRRPGEQLAAVSETVVVTASSCRAVTRFRRGPIEV